ncbi:MAG: alkaline phosphatase family protein, partial [Nitrososphaeria archaeon]
MHQIPFLIIFLDALSYKIFVNDFKSFNNGFENLRYYKMLPAIGYSSNIHWLLFLGKTADKLGYFTDWNLIENNYKNKKNLCSLSPLNYLYNIRPLNDIVRFLKGKIGLNNNNIPITEKNIFINKSCYYFNCKKSRFIEAFGKLFYFLNIDNLSESIIKNKVKSLISRYNNIMLVSNKLDNIGHLKGPSSYEYEQSCIKLVNSIIYLLKELEYSYPLNFILLSDHGMSQIKAFIDILTPIYSKYGIPGNKYYLFCDSVYLRIWTRDKYLLENIKKYLDDLYEIRFIDEDKR